MKKLILSLSLAIATLGVSAQTVSYELRYAHHPNDVKSYDTEKLRKEFLVEKIFESDKIHMTYTLVDRFILGGAQPVSQTLKLETIDALKAPNFLARREIGIINVGGAGKVKVGNKEYSLDFREALYVGCGSDEIYFSSDDPSKPAKFYFNSTPAYKNFPTKKITMKDAVIKNAGSLAGSNDRTIYQLIVNNVLPTCQLQMGLTELRTGSVWNTMPSHVHLRRMEAYFYFNIPSDQVVSHFMGEPNETRNIWLKNEQAVIAEPWSVHCGAGTSNYMFIWGMGGENLDYGDMDIIKTTDLK